MGKEMRGWPWRNLLGLSVALNVGLLLKLVIERGGYWGGENLNGICHFEKQRSEVVVIGSPEKAYLSTGGGGGGPVVSAAAGGGDDRVINLDQGDPTMYEKFWRQAGDKATIVIPGWQAVSYFSDPNNVCWFLEPQLEKEILRVHRIIGNAVTDDRYVVVGTGSTQLFQAALYALSPQDGTGPISVVSATPYYSFHRQVIDYIKSGLYSWAGDAESFSDEGPYIEIVTSPNNPDGVMRQSMVNRSGGMLIHDFAYYWPQYTPITHAADHDLMLFTASKSSGHAGMRVGWALVKDKGVAKRMAKFIELSSIGVSKDSQLRAAKILQVVSDRSGYASGLNLFEFSRNQMAQRWERLKRAVEDSGLFSLPEFPSEFCNYSKRSFKSQPAFAWLKCEGEIEDCESFLREKKILTRGGKHFGMSPKYVRISMLDRDDTFHLFVKRLSTM
ncbi:Tryptophan aminotransferase-related protein [Drosera capensis]